MEKAKNSLLWTDSGYHLFASEGLDGIQVERLARILQRNKSAFYHYFGDLEGFSIELLNKHEEYANLYMADLQEIKSIEPDYLDLLVRYKTLFMFQLQLKRSKNNQLFCATTKKNDQREAVLLRQVWGDYLGFHDNPDLALSYFKFVRDVLYMRLSFKNFNYPFLHNLMAEARELMQNVVRLSALKTEKALKDRIGNTSPHSYLVFETDKSIL